MSEEFKKYPIYEFTVWVRDNVPGSCHEQPMSAQRIFREELTGDQLLEKLQEFGQAILNRESWTIDLGENHKPKQFVVMTPAEAGLEIVAGAVSTPIYESWCLTHFSHTSIDAGEDDDYFVRSFNDYVMRMQRFNREHRELVPYSDGSGHYMSEPVCLMGAEERWRWSSLIYPDDFDPNNPADRERVQTSHDQIPCRCRFCKERGVVQINH